MIHVLEFGISLVSHIASYLRLWALSLAHMELTKIMQEMLLLKNCESMVMLTVGSLFYGVLSFILLIGEGVFTSFLHALRLQWIEFQGKFFKGDGIAFEPFYFRDADENEEE